MVASHFDNFCCFILISQFSYFKRLVKLLYATFGDENFYTSSLVNALKDSVVSFFVCVRKIVKKRDLIS